MEQQMPFKDKAKQNAWQLAWQQRRRAEWMTENGPCAVRCVPQGEDALSISMAPVRDTKMDANAGTVSIGMPLM
jgi:hypothetical protein